MRVCAMIAGKGCSDQIPKSLLDRQIPVLYHDFGVRKILSGVHRGAELITLDRILKNRCSFPELKIDGVFTHEEEANLWDEDEREQLYRMISQCDEELILKPVYGNEMRFQRNIVMMDLADIVLLLGRDREIEFWAAKLMKPILKLDADKNCMIPDIRLYRPSANG